MAVADVLPSENCLNQPHRLRCDAPRLNPHIISNPSMPSRRKRRNPPASDSKGRKQDTRKVQDPAVPKISSASKNLVIGQVTILKRGEPFPVSVKIDKRPEAVGAGDLAGSGVRDDEDLILCSTGRLGPEPQAVQKQIFASDFYAGLTSPDPSSLPFPAILPKKEKVNPATSGLIRLLGLDL